MIEKDKTLKLEFFNWLSNAVTPTLLKQIQDSYVPINVLLIKSKILRSTLTDITTIQEVDFALQRVKKTFANKSLRNIAFHLLSLYISYLQKKSKKQSEIENNLEKVEIRPDWIKCDSKNMQSFENTIPVYCAIGETVIKGKNWARILVEITEKEINNPAMEMLCKESLITSKKNRPYLMTDKIEGLNCAQLTDGHWICVNYSIPRLMEVIWRLCLKCGYTEEQITLYGAPKVFKNAAMERSTIRDKKNIERSSFEHGVPIDKSEAYYIQLALKERR